MYPRPWEVQQAFPAKPLPDGELDPAAMLRGLAARLDQASAADPGNASLARELRMTLLALPGGADDYDSALAKLFSEMGPS